MRFRSLPDGVFQQGREAGWEGYMLHLALPDGQAELSPGSLVEIESEAKVYLGEVRQCAAGVMKILVEHSLDRNRLSSIQETWR
jgi:hypothetical protein